MTKPRILVTGGTGFLGEHVVPLLEKFAEVTLVSRSHPKSVRADLTQFNGGMDCEKIKGQFDALVHLAGLYDLRVGQMEAFKQNVLTTHNALVIAQKAQIPVFAHASTIAVTSGLKKQMVASDELDTSRNFPDWYATAKAHAEHLVRFWDNGPTTKINFRLGILVGDSKEGEIKRIDGPYHTPEFLLRLKNSKLPIPKILPLPGYNKSRLPIVPVDIAAFGLAEILKKSLNEGWKNYHSFYLTPKEGVSAPDLYTSSLERLAWNKKFKLVTRIPKFILKPLAEFIGHVPQEELEYLLALPSFDSTATRKLLGENWCPEFSEYSDAFWRGYENFISNRRP